MDGLRCSSRVPTETAAGGGPRQYDVAPDGRFIMIRAGAVEASDDTDEYDHLIVVENWLDELQRLVPGN